jgi:hypothetical protein
MDMHKWIPRRGDRGVINDKRFVLDHSRNELTTMDKREFKTIHGLQHVSEKYAGLKVYGFDF